MIFAALLLSCNIAFALDNNLKVIRTFIDNGAYLDALAETETLIKNHPGAPNLLFLKATILEKSGNHAKAVNIYKAMIVDFPQYPEAYNNLAVHFANKGDYKSAINTLEAAFQNHVGYKTTYQNLQSIYNKLASDAYRKALDSNHPVKPLELTALDRIETTFEGHNDDAIDDDVNVKSNATESLADSSLVIAVDHNKPTVESGETGVEITQSSNSNTSQDKILEFHQHPKPEKNSLESRNQDIKIQIESWAKAWSNQDVDQFLSHYSTEFTSYNNLSFEDWKKQINGRLLWKEYILVELSDIEIEIDGNNAIAEFTLSYSSDLRTGAGKSSLQLQQFNGVWLITKEFI